MTGDPGGMRIQTPAGESWMSLFHTLHRTGCCRADADDCWRSGPPPPSREREGDRDRDRYNGRGSYDRDRGGDRGGSRGFSNYEPARDRDRGGKSHVVGVFSTGELDLD